MRIRATPTVAQPFITSPVRRTPSSDGRSPNGSSPSPTIRKTVIVASTQNAAMSCTLRRERKRSHGGLPPLGPSRCCVVMPPPHKSASPRGQLTVLASVSYANVAGSASGDTESIPGAAAFCPPSLSECHSCHVSLLPFVTSTEYSCRTLHKSAGLISEKILLLSSLGIRTGLSLVVVS